MERHLLDRIPSQPFPAQLEGWGGRGCPLPQKASENSSKSPHPVCDQRGSGLPLTSVLACDSPGRGVPLPSSERPWPCHVGPLCSSPTSPWWEARPAALPDSIPASWPALHGCHGNPRRVSRACCSRFASSLSGARATSGRPRGLPGRREIPRRPLGVLGLGQALTPASGGQGMTRMALGGQGDGGKLGLGGRSIPREQK